MLNSFVLLAQNDLDGATDALAGMAGGIGFVGLIIGLIFLVSGWKIFTKAGKPGWAFIVPFYNCFVLTEIIGRPTLWAILLIIPCTAPIMAIFVNIDLAKSFGKGIGFALGLIFLPIIFFPILGLGGDKYVGPAAAQA